MKLVALVFLIPACGGGKSGEVDGGSVDGTHAIDAPATAVTIHVFDSGHAPVVGRAVAFLKADDSVVAEVMTDSAGTASAPMPDGGSVTVAAPAVVTGSGGEAVLYTYLGVKNGQELTIGELKAAATTPFTVTITVPASVEPTAQNFLFNSTCNINASNETNIRTVDMMLAAGCTSADFYVETKNAQYKTLSTTWRPAQAVSAGANVDAGTAFTPVTTSTLSITNAPQFSTITPALDLVVGSFYPVPAGFNSSITITNGSGSKALTHGSIAGASLETRIEVEDTGNQFVIKRAAPTELMGFDFAAANLPTVASGVTYSPTASAVIWQESGHSTDTAAADLRIKNGTARDFNWLIVGPHTSESLHVPHLPSSLAQFNVAAGDAATPIAAIGSFPGGYERIAPHVFVEGFDFFDPFYAVDRRNAWGYVLADGDTALFASNR